MKDWEAGDVDEAAEFFRRFRQADFVGTDGWLDKLKPMATDYIEEYTAYQMAADGWKSAKTLDQKRAAAKALKDVKGKLAPKAQELAATAAAAVAKLEKERAQMLAQGKVPDGRYKLTNRKTGKSIEVEGRSHDEGHKLQTNAFSNAGHQQWHIIPQDNGYYLLVSLDSGKAIGVPTASSAGVAPAPANAPKPSSPAPNVPKPASSSPKVVTDDGTPVQQVNVNKASAQQKWRIEKVEGNFFKLTSQTDGKVLAVPTDATGNNAPIIQTTYTNAPEQQWKIEAL
jgi:hypothetical protein